MGSERVIEEIKQRLDAVEWIGRSVELKRAGRTYKACCPFHLEKTPSFVVFPHTGTWHCFGACGEGGDLFSYVQKREGLSFSEALRLLAREAGVVLEEESETQQQARAERERLIAVCEAAAQQFQAWLRDLPEGQACRDYVARRGITPETTYRFALGYAPPAWDALLSALTARDYTPEDLARVGLVRERDQGGYYDALRDRLIFPIRDVRGRIVGFGGRALHAEQVPKYINSPQTPLFDKGRMLYGLDLAKDAIRTEERAVLVEGYMDVIAAHQAGFANVVASLGTALTGEQLRLLHRYSPNLVLALDADEAGQRAAERGLEAVLDLRRQQRHLRWEQARQGQGRASEIEGEVRILTLPAGQDPDDLIRSAPARWATLVAEALPVVDYMIGQRLHNISLDDAAQKARAASDLLPLIGEIESTLVRDHYLQRLARLLRTDERTLAQELVGHMGKRRPERRAAPPPPPDDGGWEGPSSDEFDAPPPDLAEGAFPPVDAQEGGAGGSEPRDLEAYLLYLLMERPALLDEAMRLGIRAEMWEQTEHRQLFEALLAQRPDSGAHLAEWAEGMEAPIVQRMQRILDFYGAYPTVASDEWEEDAHSRLHAFMIRFDERQARQLHYLLDDLQRTLEADPQELRQLLQQQTQLEKSKLQRQRLLRERARLRRVADPNRL